MIRAAGERIEQAMYQHLGHKPQKKDYHETLLVVVGRGASDPDANSNVTKITRLLWEGLGFGWAETTYSGVTFPLVEAGLRHVTSLGYKHILVFPYFLFTGILINRIYRAVDKVAEDFPSIHFMKAGYLNDHPLVVDTFIARLFEINEGTGLMNCQLCKYRNQVLGFEDEVGLAQESHHHHVEGIGTHDHSHDHAHSHAHSHDHDHSHHDHHHHPYPHADHPLGQKTLKDIMMSPIFKDYYNNPSDIYKESGKRIKNIMGSHDYPIDDESLPIVMRMIHASGDTDMPYHIRMSQNFYQQGLKALQVARYIITDSQMVYHGILQQYIPPSLQLMCLLRDEETYQYQQHYQCTLSSAQCYRWQPYLADAIIVIGNAPTALYKLVEILMDNPHIIPRMVVALPVGFVGAEESKQKFMEYYQKNAPESPYITLLGTKGGSAMAASVINGFFAKGSYSL